jgi:hypothetical protein
MQGLHCISKYLFEVLLRDCHSLQIIDIEKSVHPLGKEVKLDLKNNMNQTLVHQLLMK